MSETAPVTQAPTLAAVPAAAEVDGITFNPDGTIRFVIDGRVHNVRRPTLGQFKQWRRLAQHISAERTEAALAQARATEAAENDDSVAVEPVDPWTDAVNRNLRPLRALFNGASADGDPHMDALSDRPLPEDSDTWPVWFTSGTWMQQLMTHWMSVPLPPGAS